MSDREQDSDADDGSDDVFTTGNKRPAPVDQLKRRRRRSYGRMAAAGFEGVKKKRTRIVQNALKRIKESCHILEEAAGVEYVFASYLETRSGQSRVMQFHTSAAGAIVIRPEFTNFEALCQSQMESAIERLHGDGEMTTFAQEVGRRQQARHGSAVGIVSQGPRGPLISGRAPEESIMKCLPSHNPTPSVIIQNNGNFHANGVVIALHDFYNAVLDEGGYHEVYGPNHCQARQRVVQKLGVPKWPLRLVNERCDQYLLKFTPGVDADVGVGRQSSSLGVCHQSSEQLLAPHSPSINSQPSQGAGPESEVLLPGGVNADVGVGRQSTSLGVCHQPSEQLLASPTFNPSGNGPQHISAIFSPASPMSASGEDDPMDGVRQILDHFGLPDSVPCSPSHQELARKQAAEQRAEFELRFMPARPTPFYQKQKPVPPRPPRPHPVYDAFPDSPTACS